MTFGASSLTTVMQMVAGGYGVTLIPQIAADVEARDARVKFLRLEEPQPGRSIGLAFRRTSPRKADFAALAKVVKESVASAPASGERRCVRCRRETLPALTLERHDECAPRPGHVAQTLSFPAFAAA